jgi:hypothetical protein
MSRLRQIPGDKFRNRDLRCVSKCQRGHVQRLANVARRLALAIFVFVEECAAGGEVKQCDSGQEGQGATRGKFGENAVHGCRPAFRVHVSVPNWTDESSIGLPRWQKLHPAS